ncbi:hypothetical protein ACFR9U_03545 [Halorientalis brevis]|uniref:Phospholipase_D-nuclease N-terminal n=1 Tax=Halorientalis brevis TaxID=1126241 RepID=A0ABD6C9J5_9EURY|nr:hypothetical protein [Halorientalis brevis]
MVEIVVPWFLAIPLAAFGAVWIYRDASKRNMDTADMWAVGFFIGFFFPPIIGAVLVYAYYLQKRNRGGGSADGVSTR